MYRKSAYELNQAFVKGELSATEITSYFLKRIEAFDGKLGSFLRSYPERALEKAKALDEKKRCGEKVGRLAAVPIGVKDNIHVKGDLTTCASKFLENYTAPFDSTATRLLEEEDAILIGKTNLDEFAMGSSNEHSAFYPVSNPWCLDSVPGGSSGGSSAACAARLAPITLGSDTGGSVRQPAAFCGIVGLKPTYGRVSRYGLVAFGSSLDQIGPFATTTRDIGMVMEVLGQHDPHDATSLQSPPDDYLDLFNGVRNKKIGIPRSFLEDLQEEPRNSFNQAIEVMKELGCEIVDIDLSVLKYSVSTYYIIATAEASSNLARFDGVRYGVRAKSAKTLDEIYDLSRTEGFGPEVKKRILLGSYVLSSGHQNAYYKQAGRVRAKIDEAFQTAFQSCDVIATPVSPIPAFPKGAIRDPLEMYLQDIYTIGVNLAHLPGISVPCGFNPKKKPFGLQFIGQRRGDPLICRMAHAYEQIAPFAAEIPPEFDREAP
ncbi:MAG: Glutamyl-tRNA(Gln) amidotransferase subunit A [Chlamydiales bacterium]|nr:Glutamyl-tRNA(Gln) amidotransferase subunit A [Chlamydiales bacterium]MCH9620045.1 Glutamyl-tRNA(Gln) amidotransferase subunit A [Chlamydiales bacterium]MCH9623536.1 Glutamyl-tRNA(Gln) amidotransferase subunit A [Chlamydiales bacterium]